VDGFHSVPLGACPLCGADVVEQPKSFGCSKWRDGCKFTIWKTIAGKTIGARTAEALLRRGRTALIRGFKSKAGNRFEARLKLDGGGVRFDFDPDDRRRPPRTPDTA
jgi:DNA topoisomerase-3